MAEVKKLNPFNDLDYRYIESWLEDMSRNGYALKELGWFVARFEEAGAKERRYRAVHEDFKDKLELDKGAWSEVCDFRGLTIYCTEDATADELLSSVDDRKAQAKSLFRSTMLTNLIMLAAIVFLWIKDWGELFDTDLVHRFDLSWGEVSMLAVIIVFSIWYVADNIATVIRYRRTRADIEVGSQITEYRSYRRRKTSAMMMLLIMLVVVLGSFFADYTIMDPAESLEYENEHLVRYAEFDPESWAIIEPKILSNTDEDVWVDCFTAENSSTIKLKEIRERVDVYYESEAKSGTSFTYDMFYNELRSEKLAVDYIDDALKYECAVTHEEAAIEVADVDYAAFAEDDGVQHLYLRKGDRVVEVYYIGDVDLRSKVELFAEKLR